MTPPRLRQSVRRAHTVLRGRYSSRWWISLAVLVFIAVVLIAWMMWRSSEPDPTEVSERFIESTSCGELRALTDEHARARLNKRGCSSLVDAAKGNRTYTSPEKRSGLERRVEIGDAVIDRDHAQVPVTVTYGGHAPIEQLIIDLHPRGERWVVHDWGVSSTATR